MRGHRPACGWQSAPESAHLLTRAGGRRDPMYRYGFRNKPRVPRPVRGYELSSARVTAEWLEQDTCMKFQGVSSREVAPALISKARGQGSQGRSMLYRTVVALSVCAALQVDALTISGAPTRVAASRVAGPRFATAFMQEAAADAAPAVEAPKAPAAKGSKTPIADLSVGSTVEGTVRSVMAYGAFVDIGASTDGLLHVSEICNEFVKDANEKLKAGETLQVRIKSVDLEKNQLALSCKDESAARAPRGGGRKKVDLSEYESADPKVMITGKVNSITDFGAFVTLKEGADGLLHISQIQEGGVGKVSDVLSVGDEVQVRVVSFDAAKRRIGLSRLPYVEGEENDGGRKKRREGGGGGGAFADDAAFKMKAEELEAAVVVDGEYDGPFSAAFARAEVVAEAKKSGKTYEKVVL